MLQIWPVETFSDNYVWILEREGSTRVAAIDPGEAGPVMSALDAAGLELGAILVTHHHGDHVGGLPDLIRRFHPPIYGSAAERVPGVDHLVSEGDRIELTDLGINLEVVALPGHTLGHVGYLGDGFVLTGDTLFAGGCGRVFEGTTEQMHGSLAKLAALPAETKAYCAHEYTLANLRFALAVEPGNGELEARLEATQTARGENQPTVPSTIGYELATNPFLRCSELSVAAAAETHSNRRLEPGAEVFGVVRAWKDGWAG